jgi:hypothetical protein
LVLTLPRVSVGDAIVGGGTLLLALFTFALAKGTYALDDRTAARARKQREREVRGVAILVDGELAQMQLSLSRGHEEGKWQWFFPLPHRAWDRDGALIVETLPEREGLALIEVQAKVAALERLLAEKRATLPLESEEADVEPSTRDVLAELLSEVEGSRGYLRKLAYPATRAPDPDDPGWRPPKRGFLSMVWPFG